MNNKKFAMTMQTDELIDNTLNNLLIDKALDLVFEDIIMGNYNFLCITDNFNNYFMQTIFENGQWTVEYSNGKGTIYKLETLEEPNEFFYLFILGKKISVDGWKKVPTKSF